MAKKLRLAAGRSATTEAGGAPVAARRSQEGQTESVAAAGTKKAE